MKEKRKNKRMQFIKNEGGMDYYLYTPSLFQLYFNDGCFKEREEPAHRYTLMHKLHMLWYILMGGYKILYLIKDGEVLSYIIFIKANNQVINSCERDDYYTIFLWTYPKYRGRGLATMMSKVMLFELPIKYHHFYKTINKDNYSSMKVAEKCGFKIKCQSLKKGLLHTIHFVEKGTQYLYCINGASKD